MDSNSKENYWDLKPYWCQPWSIITFGILVNIFIWMLFHSIAISSTLSFLVIIWWFLFLILAPRSYEVISKRK